MKIITLSWVEKIREMRARKVDDSIIVNHMLAYGLSEEERIANCFVKNKVI